MMITRKSVLSGIERTIDLPITEEQVRLHAEGGLIQNVMRNLTDDQREFYKTGITPEEWARAFGDGEAGEP